MLKIAHIKKSFGDHIILRDLSFEALSGKLTILEGQNGAGKSTLFNILIGTLLPDAGQIILGQEDISYLKAEERCDSIAILKQDPKASSLPSMNLWENCALALLKNKRAGLRACERPEIKARISAHLSALGIDYEPFLSKNLGELSGGQRQILAFAMATIIQPRLLLLDEPTAALDEQSTHLLMKLIKKLVSAWDIPAIMISHDHILNSNYGDSIVILQDGLCSYKNINKNKINKNTEEL